MNITHKRYMNQQFQWHVFSQSSSPNSIASSSFIWRFCGSKLLHRSATTRKAQRIIRYQWHTKGCLWFGRFSTIPWMKHILLEKKGNIIWKHQYYKGSSWIFLIFTLDSPAGSSLQKTCVPKNQFAITEDVVHSNLRHWASHLGRISEGLIPARKHGLEIIQIRSNKNQRLKSVLGVSVTV